MEYVYVLKLQEDKYYVGYTTRIERRLHEHFSGRGYGSQWTARYPPIEVVEIVPGGYEKEWEVAGKYVRLYGRENVKGSLYVSGGVKGLPKPNSHWGKSLRKETLWRLHD